MRRTTAPVHAVDLREKLNRKRLERAEQNAACDTTADSKRNNQRPPPDPPSFLRDPLRGDEITRDAQIDNNGQRLRGHHGRGGRGRRPPGLKTKPLNIIVEFSNPGERICTIDESLEMHRPVNSKQVRGHYRGHRNFRGSPRSRDSYSGRNTGNKNFDLHDLNENFKSLQVDKRWNKSEKYKMVPSIETTEDWATDDSQGVVNAKSKDWIPSVETTEEWTADENQGIVNDNSKDMIPSIQTREDWTTDEFQESVSDKLEDGIPSIQTAEDWITDEFQEAVSNKSKDGIPSINTTEDSIVNENQEVKDKSKDSNEQYESLDEKADDFSSNLEEESKEEKLGKEKEKEVKKVALAENNSVTE